MTGVRPFSESMCGILKSLLLLCALFPGIDLGALLCEPEILLKSSELPRIGALEQLVEIIPGTEGGFLALSSQEWTLFDGRAKAVRTFPLGDTPGIEQAASADEDGYLVFWTDREHRPGTNLHFRRIRRDRTLENPRSIPIDAGGRAVRLSAAFNGTHHLVVYSTTDGWIRAVLLTTEGSVAGTVEISPTGMLCPEISVASNGNGFAVVWSRRFACSYKADTSPFPARVAIVNAAGAVTASSELGPESAGSDVVWHQGQWVVAWSDGNALHLRRMSAGGEPIGETRTVARENRALHPRLGSASGFLALSSHESDEVGTGLIFSSVVSLLDDTLGESNRTVTGEVHWSHGPQSGPLPLLNGDVACSRSRCLAGGGGAAVVTSESVEVLSSANETAPLAPYGWLRGPGGDQVLLWQQAGQFFLATARDGVLSENRVAIRKPDRWTGGSGATTADGHFALVTQMNGEVLEGWIVDLTLLRVEAGPLSLPRGEIIGGADRFLVTWWSGTEMNATFVTVAGEMGATVPFASHAADYVAGWIPGQFLIAVEGNARTQVLEITPSGRIFGVHDLGRLQIHGGGSSDDRFLVLYGEEAAAPSLAVEIRSGETRPLSNPVMPARPYQVLHWMDEWWVYGRSDDEHGFSGRITFRGITSHRVLLAQGPVIEDDDGLSWITSGYGEDGTIQILHHQFSTEGTVPRVGFMSDRQELDEARRSSARILLVREGDIDDEVTVKVNAAFQSNDPAFQIQNPFVTFRSGEMMQFLPITIVFDSVFRRAGGTLRIDPVSAGVDATCSGSSVVFVHDDDVPAFTPSLTMTEEGEARRDVAVVLTLSNPVADPFVIDLRTITEPFLASEGEDYEPVRRSLTILPGQQTVEFPLTILGDTREEGDEEIVIEIDLGRDNRQRFMVTIADDDDQPSRRRAVRRR